MKLSIVIPSYNSGPGLEQGLEYLSQQQLREGQAIEVIVLDDGSSDDTARRVARFDGRVPGLQYVFQPRDAHSGRSRARNLGAARASGEVLTFLDAGVLVAPTFARQVLERQASAPPPGRVLLHTLRGLFTPPDAPSMRHLAEFSPESLPTVLARLAELPEWQDPREPLFDLVEDDLDRLPGAWGLGWTAAFSLPRALFEKVGGFDEGFLHWGDEDCDLTYRLQLEGASLRAERQAIALHLPHPRSEPDADEDAHILARRQRLHRKRYQLETELFIHCGNLLLPLLLSRLERLLLAYELPPYDAAFLQRLASEHLGRGPSLLLGTDQLWLAHQLPATHVAVHNKATLSRFRAALPGRTLLQSLCLDMPFEAGTFTTAIVTDALRLLGPILQEAMLRELHRVARTVLLLTTEGFVSGAQFFEGRSASSLEALREVASKAGLRLEPAATHASCTAWRLVPAQFPAP